MSDRADNCTTLAPVSPTVAKLLHKLQGQIIKEASGPREAAPGEVVLTPPKYSGHTFHEGGVALAIWAYSPCGATLRLQTNYLGDADRPHRPMIGLWYGQESRVAADGTRWERSLPNHVVDNFGDLAAVPA